MISTIINTAVTFLVSTGLGYSFSRIKDYKKRLQEKDEESKILKEALMTMLQSNLTNTYFVYENLEEIPDYVYKNWLNSLEIYEKLGGNGYVHIIAEKMKKWNISKTDILK